MHIPTTFVNFVDKATRWLYYWTDGRSGGKQGKYSMLLLHTVGRKTGQVRTHTLLYLRDGENMVVCASNNGQSHYPGWYWNLKANPRARVQAGRQHYNVVAEEVTGAEYDRLWQKFLETISLYADHRKRTARPFPILLLKPVRQED
jgi:deazaflavin-dependent oxidoreductase (nitroreductase family)